MAVLLRTRHLQRLQSLQFRQTSVGDRRTGQVERLQSVKIPQIGQPLVPHLGVRQQQVAESRQVLRVDEPRALVS